MACGRVQRRKHRSLGLVGVLKPGQMGVPALPQGDVVLHGVVDAFLQCPFLVLRAGGHACDRQCGD